MQTVDRLSYCSGTYLFWAENHSGQSSRGYEILSRISGRYQPSPISKGWESLDDIAKDIYRAWCRKESTKCEYDTVRYALSDNFDSDDACVAYFLGQYGSETVEDSSLCNYNQSDFVNIDMCYTRDLVEFYNRNEDEVLAWVDLACDGYGYTSRLHLLEGETIETPDDFAAGLVNAGMTYLGRELLRNIEETA
jgi:hypothetical protein